MPISPLAWTRDEYGAITDATGEKIALRTISLFMSGPPEERAQANANEALLFAAPIVLAALEDILELIEMDDEANEIGTDLWASVIGAKQAIRLSKGEPQ